MRRLVLSLPLVLVLCACRPAGAERAIARVPATAITMDHNRFTPAVRSIFVGRRLEFSNTSSRALHVLVLGANAQPRAQRGAPSFGGRSGHRSEVGDRWTTPSWDRPGTYRVTCTLHPSMNLEVIVSS
jgi:plastocyanin